MRIHIENLTVQLGNRTLQASHEFAASRSALFGPSGAGKTAFLETIAGLRRPQAGRIDIDGVTVVDVERGVFVPARRRGVGYVPQDLALFPHLRVRDNLLYGVPAAQGEPTGLAHVVDVLEIGALLERRPDTLSGGEKQRVALGRALLATPRVLLLDEPLASLDAALKERSLALLTKILDDFQVPMLYVTHAPEEVVALCHEVVLLEDGRIAGAGSPERVFETTPVPQLRVRRLP